MKLGKILLFGCLGIVALLTIALVAGVLVFGLALNNFAHNVNNANTLLGTGAASCNLVTRDEAGRIVGVPFDQPVALPIVGCTYTATGQANNTVVLVAWRRTTTGQTTKQLLDQMLADPTKFTGGTLTPVSGVGDSAECEDVPGTYAHIWVVKGSAVASILMTGAEGIDCTLATKFAKQAAGRL